MRLPAMTRIIFRSLTVSLPARIVCAALMNHTLDDLSPLVVYHAPAVERNLTGFDPSKLKDGTVTHIAANTSDSATISMNFTGTAVYIFVAYPDGRADVTPAGFITHVDDVRSGGWSPGNITESFWNLCAYQNTTLTNGLHTLVIEVSLGRELYFDYVRYSSVIPDPTSSSTEKSTSSPATPFATKKHKFPLGTVVGCVVGGVVLIALVMITSLLRRRALAKQGMDSRRAPIPFIVPYPEHDFDEAKEKDVASPPLTPSVLQCPSPSRIGVRKSPARLGIPNVPTPGDIQSPLSATSDAALLFIAEEMRCLGASVRRLETMPEACDGGLRFQSPPAYGVAEAMNENT
ncbi:hypothetical protein C8R47DRAFT_191099 [Mycena vitilis]|nr:hypothetical protein C8R47DRAFT_191099 [Mycena vitilis]